MDRAEITARVARHPHGRVPRALRRQQVLLEAHDLFVERGYDGASMDELARRVGVSKPVIYDVAGSKDAVFRDVMAVVGQELGAAVAQAVAAAPDDALRSGVLAFLRYVEGRRAAWAALLSTTRGPASEALDALRRTVSDQVAALVLAGAETKGPPPDPLTASALARAINGAVEFVALWWQDHPEIPAESLADLLVSAFSPGLLALARRPLHSADAD